MENKKGNFLAVSNGMKTPVFAGAMKQAGLLADSVWICTSKKWADWLIDFGVEQERVHLILLDRESRRKLVKREKNESPNFDTDAECCYRRMILADRLLRSKSYVYALAYLKLVAKTAESILQERSIGWVVMEPTWSHELVVASVAKKKSVQVFSPASIRLPHGRFAFFSGIDQVDIVPIQHSPPGKYSANAARFIEGFRKEPSRPSYFGRNDNYFSPGFSWVKKFIRTAVADIVESRDETRRNVWQLTKLRMVENVRSRVVRLQARKQPASNQMTKPYVFFPLHVQPEASIDVLGDRFSNQFETIRAICATTPSTHAIVVKEHSNFLGSKPLAFYKKIQKLPGVVLASPFADSRDLIAQASLTISITGTSSYEAALLGKPSVCLKPMFFSSVLLRPSFNPYSDSVCELLNEAREFDNSSSLVSFVDYLLGASSEGSVSDLRSDPNVLCESNIESLATAFLSLNALKVM